MPDNTNNNSQSIYTSDQGIKTRNDQLFMSRLEEHTSLLTEIARNTDKSLTIAGNSSSGDEGTTLADSVKSSNEVKKSLKDLIQTVGEQNKYLSSQEIMESKKYQAEFQKRMIAQMTKQNNETGNQTKALEEFLVEQNLTNETLTDLESRGIFKTTNGRITKGGKVYSEQDTNMIISAVTAVQKRMADPAEKDKLEMGTFLKEERKRLKKEGKYRAKHLQILSGLGTIFSKKFDAFDKKMSESNYNLFELMANNFSKLLPLLGSAGVIYAAFKAGNAIGNKIAYYMEKSYQLDEQARQEVVESRFSRQNLAYKKAQKEYEEAISAEGATVKDKTIANINNRIDKIGLNRQKTKTRMAEVIAELEGHDRDDKEEWKKRLNELEEMSIDQMHDELEKEVGSYVSDKDVKARKDFYKFKGYYQRFGIKENRIRDSRNIIQMAQAENLTERELASLDERSREEYNLFLKKKREINKLRKEVDKEKEKLDAATKEKRSFQKFKDTPIKDFSGKQKTGSSNKNEQNNNSLEKLAKAMEKQNQLLNKTFVERGDTYVVSTTKVDNNILTGSQMLDAVHTARGK